MQAFKCDICKHLFEGRSQLQSPGIRTQLRAGSLIFQITLTIAESDGSDKLPDLCESCVVGIREIMSDQLKQILSVVTNESVSQIKERPYPRLVNKARSVARVKNAMDRYSTKSQTLCPVCQTMIDLSDETAAVKCSHLVYWRELRPDEERYIKKGNRYKARFSSDGTDRDHPKKGDLNGEKKQTEENEEDRTEVAVGV